MKTVTIKTKQTTEDTREIPVPSYWKTPSGFNFYRVYERDGKPLCDNVSIYPLDSIGISCNYNVGIMGYDIVPATQEDFETALDTVIHSIEIIVNEERPAQPDSMYILRADLVPTKEPEESVIPERIEDNV